jgi:RNA polymerase sigma-70 factor (ECF subfamily)
VNTSKTAKTERLLTNVAHVSKAFEAWAPELRRYATSRTHDHAAAEDLVQEAFLRLTIQARSSGCPTNPKAWLYRVVLNLIISGSRRAEVARRRSPELAMDEVLADSAEAAILASERNHLVMAALQILGATSRTGLLLAAQGYTGFEIAAVLGRSEAATRTISCRARKVVRRELTSQGGAWLAE